MRYLEMGPECFVLICLIELKDSQHWVILFHLSKPWHTPVINQIHTFECLGMPHISFQLTLGKCVSYDFVGRLFQLRDYRNCVMHAGEPFGY